ncbi:MAG: ester cyclase [Flavobacteriales bacterium]|nr:ester cyclase [Flavobacteriales bacterium]
MKKSSSLLLAVPAALLIWVSCGTPATDPMAAKHAEMMKADSAEDARIAAQEAVARAVFEMFNTGNTDELDAYVSADFVDHQKPPEVTTTGHQMIKDMFALYRTSMPDLHQEWLHASTSGDRTYIHYHLTGTNTGPYGDMPATGKAMDVMGVDIIRFADGKAVEHWGYMEEAKMMEQLGMMGGEEEKK